MSMEEAKELQKLEEEYEEVAQKYPQLENPAIDNLFSKYLLAAYELASEEGKDITIEEVADEFFKRFKDVIEEFESKTESAQVPSFKGSGGGSPAGEKIPQTFDEAEEMVRKELEGG